MLIQQREEGTKGAFFVSEEGEQLAEMTYSITLPDIMIIDHTEVDDRLRGKNVGMQLVDRAAGYAREKQYRIIPLCPFAKSVFDKKRDQYADVLR